MWTSCCSSFSSSAVEYGVQYVRDGMAGSTGVLSTIHHQITSSAPHSNITGQVGGVPAVNCETNCQMLLFIVSLNVAQNSASARVDGSISRRQEAGWYRWVCRAGRAGRGIHYRGHNSVRVWRCNEIHYITHQITLVNTGQAGWSAAAPVVTPTPSRCPPISATNIVSRNDVF